jgi:hypothetical protein
MSDIETDTPPAARRRTVDEWATVIATGAVVAGGFLVSAAAPLLRRQLEASREREAEALGQLDRTRAALAELAPAGHVVDAAAGDGGQAGEPAEPGTVWAAAVSTNGTGLARADVGDGDG